MVFILASEVENIYLFNEFATCAMHIFSLQGSAQTKSKLKLTLDCLFFVNKFILEGKIFTLYIFRKHIVYNNSNNIIIIIINTFRARVVVSRSYGVDPP